MIPTLLSKASEVIFCVAIREQQREKSTNGLLLCNMPVNKLAVQEGSRSSSLHYKTNKCVEMMKVGKAGESL